MGKVQGTSRNRGRKMDNIHTAFIALGANLSLGDQLPAQTLHDALGALVHAGLNLRSVSRFYQTPCFPAGAGPDYINAVVRIETPLAPRDLLDQLHAIEAEMGRARDTRWGARTLDLDILDYDGIIAPDAAMVEDWMNLPLRDQMGRTPDQLLLPHPRIADRSFVLVPWADIAPDWVHPIAGQTVAQMLVALPAGDLADIAPI